MNNDDRDLIDLDSTQNWSQLDVKRELDNREVDEATGKKYDFARGFSEDKKDEEDKVLLDGLTSGLNYIPEEFLMAADEKADEEREKLSEEEKPDVSWAYRDGKSHKEEPFVPIAAVKAAEEKAAREAEAEVAAKIGATTTPKKEEVSVEQKLVAVSKGKAAVTDTEKEEKASAVVKAENSEIEENTAAPRSALEAELAAAKAKDAEIAEIRQKNIEAQAQRIAEANASDELVKANIEARKKAREALAAENEARLKAEQEAKKEAQKKAEEEMYKDELDAMFSTQSFEFIDDIPTSTKEERIAAANKNGHNADEIVPKKKVEPAEEMEDYGDEERIHTGDTGVVYIDDDELDQKLTSSEKPAKKKEKMSAADAYAAWADGEYSDEETDEESETEKYADEDGEEVVVRKKKKKKAVAASGKKKHKKKKRDKYDEDIDDIDDEEDPFFYGSPLERIVAFFKGLSGLDILVASTGILVVIAAIVTVAVYSSSQAVKNKINEFAILGEEIQEIGYAGSDKLVAVADAKKIVTEIIEEEIEDEAEEDEGYEEKDIETTISVKMTLTSVKKDLKIKFINEKNKKLVGNHKFKVDIEDSAGKKYSATDDDMDGIIYLNSVAPGKAVVTIADIEDKDISFGTKSITVTIKENIDYKKIDVSDEVKKESQINAKAEDTAVGLATEGSLKDTVEWVESTKTAIKDGYSSVSKSEITDPANITPTPANSARLGITPMVINQKQYAGISKVWSYILLRRVTNDEGSAPEVPTDTPAPEAPTNTPAPEGPTDTPMPEAPTNTPAPEGPTDTPTPSPTAVPTPSPTAIPTLTPTPTITPTPSATPSQEDKVTPLKDKKGNQLFVKSGDTYVEAKYADYYKYDTFYRKAEEGAEYKYTGWQTIGSDTYFFDKNGVKVTGEQVIQGAKYNFASDGALVKGSGTMGIDVSKWNGNIDWKAVKNSGVSFVIIRCGYRGSSTGALVEDIKFKSNIKGATDAGLKVGIYFFSQAITDVEAVEEASLTLDLIKGYKISYPVFLDVEDSNGRGDKIDKNTRTQIINAYCATIRNGGYSAGVYANKTWLNEKMNVGSLNNCKIWLAQYNTAPTYTGHYDIWQYSEKGSVGGIGGRTDMNLSYLGY